MNIAIYLAFIFLGSLTVCIAALQYTRIRASLVVGGALGLLVRAYPNRYPNMPLNDGYYYFTATQGPLETGTLIAPSWLTEWYAQAQRQLIWPMLHTYAVTLSEITGVSPDLIFRFSSALLGPITLAGAYLFFSLYFDRRWAFVAAYMVSMMDLVVYYQAEYHQQGMAMALFVFLLFAFVSAMRRDTSKRSHVLFVVFALAVALSHDFSSMFVPATLVAFVVLAAFWNRSPTVLSLPRMPEVPRRGALLVLLMFFIPTIPHLFTSSGVLPRAIISVIGALSQMEILFETNTPSGVEIGRDVPFLVQLTGSIPVMTKLLLMALSGLASIHIWRTKNGRLASLFITLAAIGVVGSIGAPGSLGMFTRIIMFLYIPLVGLSMYALYTASEPSKQTSDSTSDRRNEWRAMQMPRPSRQVVAIAVAAVLTLGMVGGVYPLSLVDSNADLTADQYYGVEPIGVEGYAAGDWIANHRVDGVDTYTIARTIPIAFYYGQTPLTKAHPMHDLSYTEGMGVHDIDRLPPQAHSARVYSNGRIMITPAENRLVEDPSARSAPRL